MDLGPLEIGLILVIVLIVFGAGKLPQVGGALGKAIREFKREKDGLPENTNVAVSTTNAVEVKTDTEKKS
jgi:sec-independent protein translocase protein TatA